MESIEYFSMYRKGGERPIEIASESNLESVANKQDKSMKSHQCNNCQFYSGSPYLVCGVHPSGPVGDRCIDFQAKSEPEESWAPEGCSYYNGELIRQSLPSRTPEEMMELLDTHPFFTGCCPQCNYQFNSKPAVHWDCPQCKWVDDSV